MVAVVTSLYRSLYHLHLLGRFLRNETHEKLKNWFLNSFSKSLVLALFADFTDTWRLTIDYFLIYFLNQIKKN